MNLQGGAVEGLSNGRVLGGEPNSTVIQLKLRFAAFHFISEHDTLREMENGTSSVAFLILEESNVLLGSLPLLETLQCDISAFLFVVE